MYWPLGSRPTAGRLGRMTRMLLEKVKRPAGIAVREIEVVRDDEHGTWLLIPAGSPWTTPKSTGRMPADLLVLLAPKRPWVTKWWDDDAKRTVEIDVCLPPERTERGWSYVDLELDPVRHEGDEPWVEIEDWDEYDEAVAAGHMSAADALLAREVAEDLAARLRDPADALWALGWQTLRDITATRG